MSDIILSCNNLSKFYGQYPALQNLDFQLKRGRIVGLLRSQRKRKNNTD